MVATITEQLGNVGNLVNDKLLFKQYRLRKGQRAEMILRAVIYLHLATFIGSAVYFLFTQVSYEVGYGHTTTTIFFLKDSWDRAPIHLQNLFGAHWFGHTQVAPHWWVTGRHDARKVIIGYIAALLVGALTVGFKPRKRASTAHMVASVPISFVAGLTVAGGLIALFTNLTPFLNRFGMSTGNPELQNLIGKGTIELTVIGFVAGTVAKLFLKRTFYTIQLMSLERNIAQGETKRWWWYILYAPNYRNSFDYLVASKHECPPHNRWLGLTLSFSALPLTFFLGFGIWLLYWGPASQLH